MTKTRGILVFARNNVRIDYVKQAAFLATRVKEYLELPVSVVTDNAEYVKSHYPDAFDQVITVDPQNDYNGRLYFDGALTHTSIGFNNKQRADAYKLSPYHETLLLDTDIVICNDMFKNCFDSKNDFLIYQDAEDLSNIRDVTEFDFISDHSIEFYWATCVFFRKTEAVELFFDLVGHIQDNWEHYFRTYQLSNAMFRNDFAFSIAIHIMNGFRKGDFAAPMPGKLLYTIDKDVLCGIQDDAMTLLVEKHNRPGEYTPIRTKGQTVHVMNKFSLNRAIDEVTNE